MALLVLALITGLFFVLLGVKTIFHREFCVICASVTIAWLVLLALFFAERINEPLFPAVLMGQSVVGLWYLWQRRVSEQFHLFRLPVLLTLTLAVYLVFIPQAWTILTLGFLAVVWLVFLGAYALRHKAAVSRAVKYIIACCKDW